MIAIIDYGLSNLLSIKRAVNLFDEDNVITNESPKLLAADKIILPGVGAYGYGMNQLKKLQLDKGILQAAKDGIPILGICLGMQMLFEDSEEGACEGLGLIKGHVRRIPIKNIEGNKQDVPHIGWERLMKKTIPVDFPDILKDVDGEVYFVHSYQGITDYDINDVADVNYGGRQICAIVQDKKVVGCQFHPEKSGPVGLKILENFIINF